MDLSALPLFSNEIIANSEKTVLSEFKFLNDEGEIYFNPEYQRDYCWEDQEQQELLYSLFFNTPIPAVAVVINKGEVEKYCEVVDGRQRLTTLFLFFAGKICFRMPDGTEIWFTKLDRIQQKTILQIKIPRIELSCKDGSEVTLRQKVEYFARINFTGKPQSQEHREKIFAMLENKDL